MPIKQRLIGIILTTLKEKFMSRRIQTFAFLLVVAFGINSSAGGTDLIGKWNLVARSCSGGSPVDVSVDPNPDKMEVEFTGTTVNYFRTQFGCLYTITGKYSVAGDKVTLTDSQLTMIDQCKGTKSKINPFSFNFAVTGNKLRIVGASERVAASCPAGESTVFDLVKM
jgi:hypothetical protein